MMMYSYWLQLPINIRHEIARTFSIPKKGATHVLNDQIQSDGYLIKDIEESLTLEKLQEYLDVKEVDMNILMKELVFRIENPNEVRMSKEQFEDTVTLPKSDITKPTENPVTINDTTTSNEETKKNQQI